MAIEIQKVLRDSLTLPNSKQENNIITVLITRGEGVTVTITTLELQELEEVRKAVCRHGNYRGEVTGTKSGQQSHTKLRQI